MSTARGAQWMNVSLKKKIKGKFIFSTRASDTHVAASIGIIFLVNNVISYYPGKNRFSI